MGDGRRNPRLGSFLLGGLVGGLAGLAAERLRARGAARRRLMAPGLAAFEQAPCYGEAVEARDAEHEQRP